MRIRYSNALLWRGLDDSPELTNFDVVDGLVHSCEQAIEPDQHIDLQSSFVMPAFRDGHCHPLFAGREHVGPDVTDATSLGEISGALRTYATSNPDVLWIDGAAYDRSITAKFHRTELDEMISDRPVVLHGADHHTLWVNTKALELCGLMGELPSVSVGSIDLDEFGVPTGVLREWEAMQLVLSKMPQLTMEQELDCLDWAQNRLLADGIVEIQDAWIDPGMTEVYLESARLGRLRVSANLAFRADPLTWQADLPYFETVRKAVLELNHPLLRVNAMKFFVDGVLGSSTASVLEPYVAGPSAHGHGEQVWTFEGLLAAAQSANRDGYQLHLHAIGDAAVRTALDIIEAVEPFTPAVIAHTELVSDSDVPRFAKLNVTANFEPLWAREDGQLMSCVPQVGRKRIDSMYRMRDLHDAGARISFGSDWPVSNPAALLGLATAVNRSLADGETWTGEQALSTLESLKAYTSGSGFQMNPRANYGTLTIGQAAEFVVLSANPFEVSNRDLFKIRVVAISTPANPLLSSI